MVDVFDQVEEELRSDRYKRLARTWLPVVGGILLIALIAALAWWGWTSWQISKAEKASVAYQRGIESLQAQNLIGADAAFRQAADEGNGSYKALALQHRAAIALQQNRDQEAVALFDEAAGATRDAVLSDGAALKAAWIVMDTAPIADVEARLEPLTEDGRPFRPFAMEALAFARLQAGQTDAARSLLVVLKSDLDAPQLVTQRADAALGSLDAGIAGNLAAISREQAQLETAARAASAAPQAPAPAAPQAAAPAATPTPAPAAAAPARP